MENRKLDQLFSERLSRMETTPSPAAWDQVQNQLGRKPRIIWWSIAASVVLLVSIVLMFRNEAEIPSSQFAEIQQPNDNSGEVEMMMPESDELAEKEVPAAETPLRQAEFHEEKEVVDPMQPSALIRYLAVKSVEEVETRDLTIATKQAPVVARIESSLVPETNLEMNSDLIGVGPQLDIQITYIASNVPDDRSGIERLWARAKEIKPGEVWANIRDTKNDFLQGKRN